MPAKPDSFVVHVSRDNRHKLFVNDKKMAQGPARGDLYFWNYETIDLASYLQYGTNYLQYGTNLTAAVVWNDGRAKPESRQR